MYPASKHSHNFPLLLSFLVTSYRDKRFTEKQNPKPPQTNHQHRQLDGNYQKLRYKTISLYSVV